MTKDYKITTLIISLTVLGCAFAIAPVAKAVGGSGSYGGYHNNTPVARRTAISNSAYVTSAPQYRRIANQENYPYNESSDYPYINEKHEVHHYYHTSSDQNSQSQARGHGYRANQQGQHHAGRENCPYIAE